MRCEVPPEVHMKLMVFWGVTLYAGGYVLRFYETARCHSLHASNLWICTTDLRTWGSSSWLVCRQASTTVRRSLRIFSRSSGQSRACPTWISRSLNRATWLLISTINCNTDIRVYYVQVDLAEVCQHFVCTLGKNSSINVCPAGDACFLKHEISLIQYWTYSKHRASNTKPTN